jgi:hypothetical protein
MSRQGMTVNFMGKKKIMKINFHDEAPNCGACASDVATEHKEE